MHEIEQKVAHSVLVGIAGYQKALWRRGSGPVGQLVEIQDKYSAAPVMRILR
jgi:hypothetical protein